MTYFRIMNHLRMAIANSDAEKARSMREKFPSSSTTLDEESRYLEDRFLILNDVVADSFAVPASQQFDLPCCAVLLL